MEERVHRYVTINSDFIFNFLRPEIYKKIGGRILIFLTKSVFFFLVLVQLFIQPFFYITKKTLKRRHLFCFTLCYWYLFAYFLV